MLFITKILLSLLFILSITSAIIFGYFYLKLTQILNPPSKKTFLAHSKPLPKTYFNFESLFSKFYITSKKENIEENQEVLNLEIPELKAVFFEPKHKVALLKFKNEVYWARQGEKIKGWLIDKISPEEVTIISKNQKVKLKLFEKKSSSKTKLSTPTKTFNKRPPKDFSEKVFVISKEEIGKLTADIGSLFTKIHLRPYFRQGQMQGLFTQYIAPGSIFDKAGLRPGDVILSINGIPVKRNEDVFRILETIQTSPSLVVKIQRGNKIIHLKAEVR